MSVVHVQTTIQTILGVVDDEGNVIQKVPVNLEVQKLEEQLFRDAVAHLLSAKAKLAESEAEIKAAQEDKPVKGERAAQEGSPKAVSKKSTRPVKEKVEKTDKTK